MIFFANAYSQDLDQPAQMYSLVSDFGVSLLHASTQLPAVLPEFYFSDS